MSELPGEDFRAFVEASFQTRFTAQYPSVPIKFADAEFNQPEGAPWVAFHILRGTSFKASLSRTYVERTSGIIQVDVMVPENSGHAISDKMAEFAARLFANRHFNVPAGGVARFRAFSLRALGVSGGFYRASARVEFEHDAQVVQQ